MNHTSSKETEPEKFIVKRSYMQSLLSRNTNGYIGVQEEIDTMLYGISATKTRIIKENYESIDGGQPNWMYVSHLESESEEGILIMFSTHPHAAFLDPEAIEVIWDDHTDQSMIKRSLMD